MTEQEPADPETSSEEREREPADDGEEAANPPATEETDESVSEDIDQAFQPGG